MFFPTTGAFSGTKELLMYLLVTIIGPTGTFPVLSGPFPWQSGSCQGSWRAKAYSKLEFLKSLLFFMCCHRTHLLTHLTYLYSHYTNIKSTDNCCWLNSETLIEEVPLLSPCALLLLLCYLKFQATMPLGTPNFHK